jgi:hypothetical protein
MTGLGTAYFDDVKIEPMVTQDGPPPAPAVNRAQAAGR